MTTVRIAHAEPKPGQQPGGKFFIHSILVILADDAGSRALPVWLRGPEGHGLWRMLDKSGRHPLGPGGTEETTVELLRAADVSVTGVDVDELDRELTMPPPAGRFVPTRGMPMARIAITGPAGSTHSMEAPLGYSLTLAAGSGVPVRVADAVMDRLAVPVQGDDLLAALAIESGAPDERPEPPPPHFDPRNLAFADGLVGWEFGGSFRQKGGHAADYSCVAEGGVATLSSQVTDPHGSAGLVQTSFNVAYEGCRVVFRAECRSHDVVNLGGLYLHTGIPAGPVPPVGPHTAPLQGSHDWASHEVAGRIPDGAGIIQFGMFLDGPGRVELRNAQVTIEPKPEPTTS